MALVLADRVQQTGTANTTVSFTLSGSVTGFQSFAVVGNTNTTYYSALDGTGNWEVGIGTYATGGTLTRTTIISSSNAGAAVTFSGTVNVIVTYPSAYSVVSANSGKNSEFAATTALVFQQTAAPTGWTKVTTNNDAALRVVSGTAGTGGTVGFTTAFASQAVSGSVATTGSTTATGSVADTGTTTAAGTVGTSGSTTATGSVADTASATAGGSVATTGSTTATGTNATVTGSVSTSITGVSGSVSTSTSTSTGITYLNDPYYMPSHAHRVGINANTAYTSGNIDWSFGGPATCGFSSDGPYGWAVQNTDGNSWYAGSNGYHNHSASSSSSSSFSFSSGSASSSFSGSAPIFTGTAHTHTGGAFTGTAHSHTNGAFTGVAHTHTGGTFTGTGHTHTSGAFTGVGHTHTSGAFTGTAINLAVKYVDVIVATKD